MKMYTVVYFFSRTQCSMFFFRWKEGTHGEPICRRISLQEKLTKACSLLNRRVWGLFFCQKLFKQMLRPDYCIHYLISEKLDQSLFSTQDFAIRHSSLSIYFLSRDQRVYLSDMSSAVYALRTFSACDVVDWLIYAYLLFVLPYHFNLLMFTYPALHAVKHNKRIVFSRSLL